MNRNYLMMAAVAAALAGPVAAHAQQADPQQAAPQQPMPQTAAPAPTAPDTNANMPTATPASQAAMPASATVGGTDASGAQVVSNGPVPDTPANRHKYGRPMSMAGKMTKPAGN